jgi:hypothetical protein
MTGLVVVILAVGLLFAILTPLPLEEVPGLLPLAIPSLAAAFVGVAVGGAGRTHRQR